MTLLRETESVREVIRVLNSGAEFYQEAAVKVSDNLLHLTLEHILEKHLRALNELQTWLLAQQGEMELDTSLPTSLRQESTKLLVTFSRNPDRTYVSQLEEVENDTLGALTEAIAEAQDAKLSALLEALAAEFDHCRAQLRNLERLYSNQ